MTMPSIPILNANIIVILILVAMGIYGLLAGKQRLRILILSVYVGIVLAEQLSDLVRPILHMISPEQVSWVLLAVPILIFGFIGVVHGKNHDRGATVANIIVGFLTGGLIISSALHLLPTSQMAAIDSESFIAMSLQQYHLWILGGLPIVALLLGFMKGEKHH
ncbi:MAG: hypothetical protein JWN01_202 [Patescibacteria group bacterium]|jgi:hypothetical protein|nr:hypothetical protein [Patescibacteria group bacterium]